MTPSDSAPTPLTKRGGQGAIVDMYKYSIAVSRDPAILFTPN